MNFSISIWNLSSLHISGAERDKTGWKSGSVHKYIHTYLYTQLYSSAEISITPKEKYRFYCPGARDIYTHVENVTYIKCSNLHIRTYNWRGCACVVWLCWCSVCTLFVSTSIDAYLSNQRFYGSIAFLLCELEIVASNYFCFILERDGNIFREMNLMHL